MAKKPAAAAAAEPAPRFDPDAEYQVVFSGPVRLSAGILLRAGVPHTVQGSYLPALADWITAAEKV